MAIRRRGRRRPQQNYPRFDRNHYIKAYTLRVIDNEGNNLGVMSKDQALRLAQERELDLILVNPQIDPPVAKIEAWSKFKYDLSKKQKGSKKKGSELKEMRIKTFIDDRDLSFKIKLIEGILKKGHKVKVTVGFVRGSDREKMQAVINKVLEGSSEFAKPEGTTKPDGRNMTVFLVSK